ncbi:MAG: antitoxin VbhA family protein [Solirubrobacteraceae bacterium]
MSKRPASSADRGPATRPDAAADALASVRAEGLDPGRAEPLLAAWARGELTDAQLEQARSKLLTDRSLAVEELLEELLGPRP